MKSIFNKIHKVAISLLLLACATFTVYSTSLNVYHLIHTDEIVTTQSNIKYIQCTLIDNKVQTCTDITTGKVQKIDWSK